MNAHSHSNAVAGDSLQGPSPAPKKARKSRARFAYLFDMTDDKEREVCRRVSYFHLGGDYTAIEFRRTTGTDGQRILWALVDTVPRWRDRGLRWSVCWWNIDTGAIGSHDRRTRDAAASLLNQFTLH